MSGPSPKMLPNGLVVTSAISPQVLKVVSEPFCHEPEIQGKNVRVGYIRTQSATVSVYNQLSKDHLE
jgi:hypothetical protein